MEDIIFSTIVIATLLMGVFVFAIYRRQTAKRMKSGISVAGKKMIGPATNLLPGFFSPKRMTLAIYGIENNDGDVSFHDHSVVLMDGNKIIAMVELERLSRNKQDAKLSCWLDQILFELQEKHKISHDNLDVVVVSSMHHCSVSSNSKKFIVEPANTADCLAMEPMDKVAQIQEAKCVWNGNVLPAAIVSHELAHVFSCVPFLDPDNLNERDTTPTLLVHFDGAASEGNFSAWMYADGKLELLQCHWELSTLSKHFNDNGLVFAILGADRADHLSVPGKMMGLQSYGTARPDLHKWLKKNDFFRECWSDNARQIFQDEAKRKFGWKPDGKPFDTKDQFLQDIVATLHKDFTSGFLCQMESLKKSTGAQRLCLSGGCALNISATTRLEETGWFEEMCIPPCCSDAGLALGGAAFVEFLKNKGNNRSAPVPYLNNVGRAVSGPEANPNSSQTLAHILAKGKVVGICQGLGECGPRALGNRSIVALPTTALRDRISLKMKKREWYRPVAPVMKLKHALKVTGRESMPLTSRYMLSQFKILPEYRDQIAGAVHVDGTSRIQVLFDRLDNPLVWDILTELELNHRQIALLNTSFNRRGEPIVHSVQDAESAARAMEMDALYTPDKVSYPSSLRILLVNHGYPPAYNAGSEVYTQTLARSLTKEGFQVAVFSRKEDPFLQDYELDKQTVLGIPVYLMNHARSNARFHNTNVDQAFATILQEYQPDIVHFGHLNHLSTGLVSVAKKHAAKVVFTLHDFWLACPRGQFLQWGLTREEPFQLCNGQEDLKCAEKCFNRFPTGLPSLEKKETLYWRDWVSARMQAVRELCDLVDVFIAPSEHLSDRMCRELPQLVSKIKVIDYGFDVSQLPRRPSTFRAQNISGLVFGYTGRHHPSKGVNDLIRAFYHLDGGDSVMRIWGRKEGQLTQALKELIASCEASALQKGMLGEKKLEFMPEYSNADVYDEVFMRCDVVIVPSIWDENSPLVIHEALQCRVPVITAAHGGMGEFVRDGVNGYTFKHRDGVALAQVLLRALENKNELVQLSQKGYLKQASGNVLSSREETRLIGDLYDRLVLCPTPWRITFDTNITQCNLNCVMCEGFSIYKPASELTAQRKKQNARIMDIEIVKETLYQCVNTGPHPLLREIIPSTMGEPLMYHDFQHMLDLCNEHGLKLNLTTNGTFPKKGARKWASLILPCASDVKISWNGATKRTMEDIMVGSKWESRIKDLEDFLEVREEYGYDATVTLQATFLERSISELPALVDFAIDHGIDRLKGHHLWSFYDQIKDDDMRRTPDSIRRWNEIVVQCQQRATARPLPPSRRHQKKKFIKLENFDFLSDQQQIDDGWECPFLGKEAWISPEGVFSPCCAPSEQRKALGDFGNLHEKPFLQIWNSAEYRDLVKTYKTKPLCKTCLLRRPPSAPQRQTASRPIMMEVEMEAWSSSRVSDDSTHHVSLGDGQPLYTQRFETVLSFHEPGLAAAMLPPREPSDNDMGVETRTRACHVTASGEPAYQSRFLRTFGFYDNLAAVIDATDGSFFFIRPDGTAAHAHQPQWRWRWAGNFVRSFSVVRSLSDGLYYYVNAAGTVTRGPYLYAGDVGTDLDSVVYRVKDGKAQYARHDQGSCQQRPEEPIFDYLQPRHKQVSVARQNGRLIHIDESGNEMFSRSSNDADADAESEEENAVLEPFYNGYSFFVKAGGSIGILAEDGSKELLSFDHQHILRQEIGSTINSAGGCSSGVRDIEDLI